jgi:hypothetical protein
MTGYSRLNAFTALPREDQLKFLLRFAHDLTIVGRDTYQVGTTDLEAPTRLREINEVQHRLLAFSIALLEDDPKRYPDEVLVQIALEHPEDAVLQAQVLRSFDRAMSAVGEAA